MIADVKKLINAAEWTADKTTPSRDIDKYAILNDDLLENSEVQNE